MRDIAIIIINYQSAQDCADCIDTLKETAAQLLSEIVVVDNASCDGSVELLRGRHPDVKVLALDENRGFAAGVNRGVVASTAPILFVLNPDTSVLAGAVESLRTHLLGNPTLGVVGPVLLDGSKEPWNSSYKTLPSLLSLFVGSFFPLDLLLTGTRLHPELKTPRQARHGGPVARICGAAMLIRREAWDDAGPMDEGYFLYSEEVEWQSRAVAKGWQIEQVVDAKVVHAIRGGEATEIWPPVALRSGFRYLQSRGHSAHAISLTVRAGFLGSRLVLAVASLVPSQRAKARRMSKGYKELSALAAALGRRPA